MVCPVTPYTTVPAKAAGCVAPGETVLQGKSDCTAPVLGQGEHFCGRHKFGSVLHTQPYGANPVLGGS